MRTWLVLFILSILVVPSYANEVSLYVPAVRETDYGYQGVLGTLNVKAEPGNGRVYVDTLPLTEIDTQSSARLAKEVLEDVLNVNMEKYDLFFVIRSDSPIVGGPSAGGAMTAAAIASFLNLSVDNSVVMTGTINPDGSIGPIGGVFEKAQAVARNNGTVFLVPEGQSIIRTQETKQLGSTGIVSIVSTPVTIDLREYAMEKWSLKVLEISDIREAVKYMTGYEIEDPGKGVLKENPYLELIMREMAEEKLDLVGKKLEDAKESLTQASLSYEYTIQLQKIVDDQSKRLSEARELFSSGKYYSSSSKLFIVAINLEYVENVIKFIESKSSKNYAESLIISSADYVKLVEQRVNQSMNKIDNITDIEIISASQERMLEAESHVNDAWQSFYRSSYLDAIYYASYAKERANTADTWLSLTDKFSGSRLDFSFDKLKGLAERRIEDATSSIIYASTIGIDLANEDAMLEDAKESYQNGAYSTAIFNAIMARAGANLKMEIRGQNDLSNRVARYENNALLAIQKSEQTGAFPVLAISYLEYGKSFADSDHATALRYMKYAKEFADASKDIYKIIEGRTQEEQLPVITQTPESTSLLPAAMLIAGLAIGLIAGSKIKSSKKRRR